MIFSTFLGGWVMEDLVLMVATGKIFEVLPISGEHGLVGKYLTLKVKGFHEWHLCHCFVVQLIRQIKLDVQEAS